MLPSVGRVWDVLGKIWTAVFWENLKPLIGSGPACSRQRRAAYGPYCSRRKHLQGRRGKLHESQWAEENDDLEC